MLGLVWIGVEWWMCVCFFLMLWMWWLNILLYELNLVFRLLSWKLFIEFLIVVCSWCRFCEMCDCSLLGGRLLVLLKYFLNLMCSFLSCWLRWLSFWLVCIGRGSGEKKGIEMDGVLMWGGVFEVLLYLYLCICVFGGVVLVVEWLFFFWWVCEVVLVGFVVFDCGVKGFLDKCLDGFGRGCCDLVEGCCSVFFWWENFVDFGVWSWLDY